MIKTVKQNNNWTQIIIDDPLFLPGKSIVKVIQLLLTFVEFKYIILTQIYGVTEAIAFLEKKENIPLKICDILNSIDKVRQFDWGDFFLFKKFPKNWENFNEIINYPDLIVQADTTIRAVDDQYIYIYTKYIEIVNLIKDKYIVESIKTGLLSELDYPY